MLISLLSGSVVATQAQTISPTVTASDATLNYPKKIEFTAAISNADGVRKIILEYGVVKRSCGEVVAQAFPDFTPGTMISVRWTWEMLKSGSEPPGTHIWYSWKLILEDGRTITTERKELVWLNASLNWQTLRKGYLLLHWYNGPETFAQTLLDAADSGLQRLAQNTGLIVQTPIHIYIFKDYAALRDSILYQPGWIGGIAFSDYAVATLGISTGNIAWGKRAIVHELTHILVGNMLSGCIVTLPAWLNEGIAVYSEGEPDQENMSLFNQAKASGGTLLSVRALSGSFSEEPGKADLSYMESYSIVNFLIRTYGQGKLLSLFQHLNSGETVDAALQNAYGFGIDGLETQWRTSIGLSAPNFPTPTQVTMPTIVPTYLPAGSTP